MTNPIRVVASALYIYPVKSCAPVMVERLEFDGDGLLVGDREWAVVDADSCLVWQGAHPKLALVVPELNNGTLSLRGAGGDHVVIQQDEAGSLLPVRIWNDMTQQNETCDAADQGQDVADFLGRTVGAKLRLVRLSRAALLRAGTNPIHVVSTPSFDELSAALATTGSAMASLFRFRPNLVLSEHIDPFLAFLEEQFTGLEWTEGAEISRLTMTGRCTRCTVPNVNPVTGLVDHDVLGTVGALSNQRFPGQPVYFGVYAKPAAAACLHRGTVLSAGLAF